MNEEIENIVGDVGSEPVEQAEDVVQPENDEEELPKGVKKRIGQLKKQHNRVTSEMRDRIAMLERQVAGANNSDMSQPNQDAQQGMQPQHNPYMQQHYMDIERELHKAASKYEDFDDVVRDHRAPFTEAIRDAASLTDNMGDVLYELGKNRDELYRISSLPPISQAREVLKLSKALTMRQSTKAETPKVMGQIKNNPAAQKSTGTSVADFRARMKAGTLK